VEHQGREGARSVTVTITDDGRAEQELGAGTARPDEVLDLIRGAAYPHWDHNAQHDHWRVETSRLSAAWPEGLALQSVSQPPPVFDLVGPEGTLLWIQGVFPPQRLPPLDRMEGPDQTAERIGACQGGQLVELRYNHEGRPWRMFHCLVDRFPPEVCLITAQAPERWRELALASIERVAETIGPCAQPG
jgi:hypothetical protein